jgi:hypothetical protein
MRAIKLGTVLVFLLGAALAWGVPFSDDFNRPDGEVGNGWSTQTDGTIKVEIVDQEVLIHGQQATNWRRCGIFRPVEDETKIQFDFLANDKFNVHIRIDDTATGAYIDVYAWPGGPFSYASSKDGSWPGWTQIPGSNMIPNEYNTLRLEQEGTKFILYLNDKKVETIENTRLEKITKVLLSSDAAAGTSGSLHIDNVVIGEPSTAPQAVDPKDKLAATWGGLKKM